MHLTKIHILRYRLPLLRPLRMLGTVQHVRMGALIKIIFEDGCIGLGELAPFPGLHNETLALAIQDLKKLLPLLGRQAKHPTTWILPENTCPSLHFALDTALLDARANKAQIPAAEILNADYCKTVSLNGLLTGSLEEIQTKIKKNPPLNPKRIIKVKVGARLMEDEIALIRFLDEKLPAGLKLRLDANRQWNKEQAVYFAKHIPLERIDYIEEPIDAPQELDAFYKSCGMPFALDETLQEKKEISHSPGLKALIIKPSVIGSIERMRMLSVFARQHGLLYVISSVFESGVGLRALANLAAAYGTKNTAVGLDTYKWFATDVSIPAFSAPQGLFSIASGSSDTYHLRNEILEKEVITL